MAKTEKLEVEESSLHNPMKKRSCTDVLCLLLFLVFLAGWMAIAAFAFSQGNPEVLVFPSNSSGVICGRGENAEKPYVLFHDLTRCLSLSASFGCPTPQVCVKECPKENTQLKTCGIAPLNCEQGLLESYRKYCVPMTDEEWGQAKENPKLLMEDRKCPSYTLISIPILGRCVPDFLKIEEILENGNQILDAGGNSLESIDDETKIDGSIVVKIVQYATKLLNARDFATKVWGDLATSWYWILGGQGVALLVSFLWIFLMRLIPGPLIYLSMLLTLCLLGLSTAYSWVKYKSLVPAEGGILGVNPIQDGLSTYLAIRDTWLIFFIISICIFVIVLLVLLFLRSRINIAVELIKESSKAVGSIFTSLFFPIIPFLLQLLVVGFFCLVAMFLASVGEQQFVVAHACEEGFLKDGDTCDPNAPLDSPCANITCIFDRFSPSDVNNYLQLYNIFALFWGIFFVTALGELVLAGGFASWYWAEDKEKDVPTFALSASFYRSLRYHVGTLAFGSLIITIIRMIRLMIQYIENKLKEKGMDNILSKILLCLCKCCFWCLEKFMKFLNRNAYIVTASYGYNFCKSAKEAFSLILRNIARVAVLDKVTDFLLFLGKLVVVGGVALLSYYVFSGGLNNTLPLKMEAPKLNYYFVPVIIITISAYMIASCFFSVFSMAVDTLFLCFLLDLEKNEKEEYPHYHMSKNLMKILKIKDKKKSK